VTQLIFLIRTDIIIEGLEPRPLFYKLILIYLAIFIIKNVFRDYKIIEKLLSIKSLKEEEIFHF
jgi:hypothetical protein